MKQKHIHVIFLLNLIKYEQQKIIVKNYFKKDFQDVLNRIHD